MPETQKNWLSLEIIVEAKATEAIEFALNEIGALGTEINLLGKREPLANIAVIGYFNEKPVDDFLQKELTEALRIYDFDQTVIKNFEWREVKNKDWLEEWKKHWKPTETEKFIIAPPWAIVENNDKLVIRIDPSMAFGTGTHETTRLCLKTIEEIYKGESFFDVGTGTGILAIAAAKIKSESSKLQVQSLNSEPADDVTQHSALSIQYSLVACDTDEDSIKIAEENAEINGAQGIEFYVGSINRETPKFDFVCANLTADVIVPLLPLLIEKAGKILLLSGILKEQEEWVARALRELRITNYELRTDAEWISILVVNGKQ